MLFPTGVAVGVGAFVVFYVVFFRCFLRFLCFLCFLCFFCFVRLFATRLGPSVASDVVECRVEEWVPRGGGGGADPGERRM